jgi:hypothetical protein
VGSLLSCVTSALALKDIRPSTRRGYLTALRPFLDLDVDSLPVTDLNERLLAISNQNSRRQAVIALKACVDHPAVGVLRVPAAVPRDYDLPDETTIRLALLTCPHETRKWRREKMPVLLALGASQFLRKWACTETAPSTGQVWP